MLGCNGSGDNVEVLYVCWNPRATPPKMLRGHIGQGMAPRSGMCQGNTPQFLFPVVSPIPPSTPHCIFVSWGEYSKARTVTTTS